MPILNHWEISPQINDVLRAQGADPEIILKRRPELAATTEESIIRGHYLIHPLVLYEKYEVSKLVHERLELVPIFPDQKRPVLSSSLISQHLGRAQMVIVMICTIGNELDDFVGSMFKVDPL